MELSARELLSGCAPVPAPAPDELRPRSCGARGTGAVAPRPQSLSLHHVWHLANMGHPRCFARVATKQRRIQSVENGQISRHTEGLGLSWEHTGVHFHQQDKRPKTPVYETAQGRSTKCGAADCALGKRGSLGGIRCVVGARAELVLISVHRSCGTGW